MLEKPIKGLLNQERPPQIGKYLLLPCRAELWRGKGGDRKLKWFINSNGKNIKNEPNK
jgi:hypothetical protein